jgi:DNA-binding response OmpR family regulator
MPEKILVIEDEETIADSIRYNLEREGYEVTLAFDGAEGLTQARKLQPNLILLDLMLPQVDGLEVCRRLRENSDMPIIMLTAKAADTDRVVGLELGADDYIVKPFNMREVIARVRAVLRRVRQAEPRSEEMALTAGDLTVNVAAHEARLGKKTLDLSPKEFELLCVLMSNAGRVLARDNLLQEVWGEDPYCDSHTLEVHIHRLREKIENNPQKPRRILTVRGVGYKFVG